MTTASSRTAAKVEVLRSLVRHHQPVTSVILRSPRDNDPPQNLALRWAALRRGLAETGAPEADLLAIDEAVPAIPRGDHAMAVFAAAGHEALRMLLDGYDGEDEATYAPWPRALPVLRWSARRVPTVVAVVGHGDAHLTAYDETGAVLLDEAVIGDNDEIERNAPGGWSQPRYRRRAEDSWRRNATQFVGLVEQAVEAAQARLLIVAGDAHEVSLVVAGLPDALRAIASTAAHPVEAFNGVHEVPRSVVAEQARMAAEATRKAELESFDVAAGRRQAVEGEQDVRHAFYAASVAQLVVVHGVATPSEADAFIAAALDTDADILIAQPEDIDLVDGVGAKLRF